MNQPEFFEVSIETDLAASCLKYPLERFSTQHLGQPLLFTVLFLTRACQTWRGFSEHFHQTISHFCAGMSLAVKLPFLVGCSSFASSG